MVLLFLVDELQAPLGEANLIHYFIAIIIAE
jgi:hypothetical protein